MVCFEHLKGLSMPFIINQVKKDKWKQRRHAGDTIATLVLRISNPAFVILELSFRHVGGYIVISVKY